MYLGRRLFVICLYLLLIKVFGTVIKYLEILNYIYGFVYPEVNYANIIFDYVIVGSGTAGAVLARRLAESGKNKILVLEAGGYGTSILNIPSLALVMQQSSFDWQYKTVPQEKACFALEDNASKWAMGKIVGGTGMLNNMLHVRGHPEDFKEWYRDEEGFDYKKHVLPYFEKSEMEKHAGVGKGSTYVQNLTFVSKLPEHFLNAVESLGFSVSADIENCEKGFGIPKVNALEGARWTPIRHLLNDGNKNIYLRADRTVRKVLFHDDYEAYGVQYSYGGKLYEARGRKGIILAAGVIGSPKILLHSGIGPEKHLRDVNIEPKVDLPVGKNLQDHLTTAFDLVLLNQTLGISLEQMLSPLSVFDYFWNGKGPWTTSGCEVIGFFNTNTSIDEQDSSLQPDLQFMVMPLGINEDRGSHLRHLIGITDDTWNNYFALLNDSITMTILPIVLHPKSRGYIRLRDNKFESKPLINPRYLSHNSDIEVLLKGIQLIKDIVNTKSMRKLGAKFNTNVYPKCAHLKYDSERYWKCYLRHLTITSYHPVGTCKMGSEEDSSTVVNYNFGVKNTNKLFVVDGSVMPTLTSGNINSAILMLAEMASDLIKLRTFLNESKCKILEIFISRNYC